MEALAALGYFIPELLLVIGAMTLLIVGVYLGDGAARRISVAAAFIAAAALVAAIVSLGSGAATAFAGSFRIDAFSAFAKIVIFGAAAIAILMSDRYLAGEKLGRFEYPVLILLSAFGMSLMTSASDLVTLYMGVETQSLALYVLAAFNRDSRRSTEAGLKYFVLGALSSCLLLYGASLIYGFSGSTQFDAIATAAAGDGEKAGLIVGLVFLISGLAFKVSAAPFHMWTPDVYEGAPTPVTAFLAAAPKFAAMALFARALIEPFSAIIDDWRPVIALISILSMSIGAVSAIRQTNIKRLMAYSSIGHMGYALIALAAGTQAGVGAILIYMTIYVAMTIGAFACILLMRRRGGMSESIADLAGLSRTNGGLAVILTALLFSLAGIPPLAGFLAKWAVFVAAVEAGLVWLAVIGAVVSVVSAYYYLRIVKTIWMDEPATPFERDGGAELGLTAAAAALLMFVLILPGVAGPFQRAAEAAAASLF
jgi:NADH-quinone oxidoreductase subunit N